MTQRKDNNDFFDIECKNDEQIPRSFTAFFEEVGEGTKGEVKVILNGMSQIGDVINDNSYTNDFYRYHDVFHYTFAAVLGWSPCTRAMMRRKRKSYELVDKIEDGARASITEEAISMIVFNEAKRKDYFNNVNKVSKITLRIIKEMTENFEVKVRSAEEWERAILKSYEMFRLLIKNHGGKVEFDLITKEVAYSKLN